MMQWTDGSGSRPAYSSSSTFTPSDVTSGTNSNTPTNNHMNSHGGSGEVKKEADVGRSSNNSSTDRLQFCLSMLPQSCSCKSTLFFQETAYSCNLYVVAV